MKFSPDGKLILISTNGQILRLIDAFQGTPLQTFMVKLETRRVLSQHRVEVVKGRNGEMNLILFIFLEKAIDILAHLGLDICFMNMTVSC